MVFSVVHKLPGRLRLRFDRHSLNARQAELVQTLVSLQKGIDFINVNPVSGGILLEYSGISEKTALSYIRALDDSYLTNEELLSAVSVPEAQESLAAVLFPLVAQFFIRKLLPLPIRSVLSLVSIIPRLKKGRQPFYRVNLFVPIRLMQRLFRCPMLQAILIRQTSLLCF